MTPQPQPGSPSQPGLNLAADLHPTNDLHLTSDQMSDLLVSATATESLEAHLRTCPVCATELANLREALYLFQQATTTHADREFARLQRRAYPMLPTRRLYPQTLFWLAASAVLMAGILPLEMRWQRTSSTPTAVTTGVAAHTTESDEALLEDINRDLSVSVPTPMQPLADPTGMASQTSTQTDTQTTTQRKD